MQMFEYMVVPAPKAEKARGVEQEFATALQDEMNRNAADGWEYQRTESIPVEEHFGPGGRRITYHSVLVFRRQHGVADTRSIAAGRNPADTGAPALGSPTVSLGSDADWPTIRREIQTRSRPAQDPMQDVAVRLRSEARAPRGQDQNRPGTDLPPLVLGRQNAVEDTNGRSGGGGALDPTLAERAAALARKMAAE